MASVTGRSWVLPKRGDGTLNLSDYFPVLSGAGVQSIGVSTATLVVTVSRSGGTLYYVLSSNATPPTPAQIKAGQDSTGAAGTKAGNAAVSSIGQKSFALTGLSGGGTKYAYFVHNVVSLDSPVAAAAGFTLSVTTPTWTTPPTQNINRSGTFPTYINNIRQYLSDPSSVVTAISITGAIAQVTYDSANDRIAISADPGSNQTNNIQLVATYAGGTATSVAFSLVFAAAVATPTWISDPGSLVGGVLTVSIPKGGAVDITSLVSGAPGGVTNEGDFALPAGVSIQFTQSPLSVKLVASAAATVGAQVDGVYLRLQEQNPTAESDWNVRKATPECVGAVDFRTQSEVDRYIRVAGFGYDPNRTQAAAANIQRITNDGIGSNNYCLRVNHPNGSGDQAMWIRPFSPRAGEPGATNGLRGVDGNLLTQFPDPTGGSDIANWGHGNYANAAYNGAGPVKDGNDLWIQMRIKVDPNLATGIITSNSGKLFYIDLYDGRIQEIVAQNDGTGSPYSIVMYTAQGPSLEGSGSGPTTDGFFAGEFSNSQGAAGTSPPNWKTPYGVWDTFMIHLGPGTERDNFGPPTGDTVLEIWAAHQGATQWTKIFNRSHLRIDFQSGTVNDGWNCLKLSVYYEGDTHNFWHQFAQVLHGRARFPLPLV